MSPRAYALLALVAVTGLAVAPSAFAQVPQSAGVELESEVAEVRLSVDAGAQATLKVTNTGSSLDPLVDPVRTIVLETTGVPAGWSAVPVKTVFRLKAGASESTVFNVAVQPGGAQEVTFTITAKVVPLGLDVIPIVGPLLDPDASDTITIKAVRQDTPTRQVLESVGPLIWPLIAAAILLVLILIALAARGGRQPVTLRAEPMRVTAPAASPMRYSFHVTNTSRRASSIVLQTSQLPAGWTVDLQPRHFQLEAGASQGGTLIVRAPPQARGPQGILLSATSSVRPGKPANLTLTADAQPHVRKK